MQIHNNKKVKKTDLLIIDADGTIGPHLTVGLANQVALHYIVKLVDKDFKIKKRKILSTRQNLIEILKNIRRFSPSFKLHDYYMALKVVTCGILLYVTKVFIDLFFNLGITRNYNNSVLVRIYLFALKGVKLDPFLYTAEEIKRNAYPGIFEFVKKFKKAKKVLISQSFAYSSKGRGLIDQYSKLIKFDDMVMNEFVCKDVVKTGRVRIRSMKDKTKYALKIIKKYKSKNVAVLANDYADIGIAKLAKLTISRKPPRPLEKVSDIVVEDYRRIFK